MRLFVSGGRQRGAVNLGKMVEWSLYEDARLLDLDTQSGEVSVRLGYTTPPELCAPDDPSHVFKAGSWGDGGKLWLVTQTEVLEVDPQANAAGAFRIARRISHPWFNDLHHAAFFDDCLQVVSTGLDALLVLDEAGEVLAVRDALGREPSFERECDYRRIATTKPHASHPNYVFRTPSGTWVTRFEQRDALCLDDPSRRAPIEVGRPHDGIAHAGAVWFTTVNGHVVAASPEDGTILRRFDLNRLVAEGSDAPDGPLGWCRGLAFAEGLVFVGFSRIRYTRFRQNLSWVKQGFRKARGYTERPTRILALDLERGDLRGEWDLEPFGMNAVFSILPGTPNC